MSVAAMAMDEHRPLMNSYDKMSKSYEQNQGAGVSSAVGGGVGSAPPTPNAGHLSGPASPTPSGSDEPGVINAAYHIYSHHPQQHQHQHPHPQQHYSHHFQHQQRQLLLKSSTVSGPASPPSPMEITESATPLSSASATSVAVSDTMTTTATVTAVPATAITSMQHDQQQQSQSQSQSQQQQHFHEASDQDTTGTSNINVATAEQHQRKLEEEILVLKKENKRLNKECIDALFREKVLIRRLANKEHEYQDYINQIAEYKAAQAPEMADLRNAFLDPAVNMLFERLKKELKATKAKLEETQNELSAWKFTPDSNTGKRLMAKCRLLYQENEELGKMTSNGRVAKLETELAMQKSFAEEVKKSQSELDDFLQELDEDVEGMQSTILFLQQELKNTRERIQILEKENLQLKSGRGEMEDNSVCDDQRHNLHDVDNNDDGNSYKLEENSMTNLTQSDENSTLMGETCSDSATPMDCTMSKTMTTSTKMIPMTTTTMESVSTISLTTANTMISLLNTSVDRTVDGDGINNSSSTVVKTINEPPTSLAEISTNKEKSDHFQRLSETTCRIESADDVANVENSDNNSTFVSNIIDRGLYNGVREGTTTEQTDNSDFNEDGTKILASASSLLTATTSTMSNEMISSITGTMSMICNDSELRSSNVPINEISTSTESLSAATTSASTLNYCATGHKMRTTLAARKRTYDGEMVPISESMQPINMVSAPRTLPPKKSKLRVANISSNRSDVMQLLQDTDNTQITTTSSLMCNANSNDITAMVSSVSISGSSSSNSGGVVGDNDNFGNIGTNVTAQQNIYLPSNNSNSANNTINNNMLMELSTSPTGPTIGSGGSDGNELTGTMGGMSPRIMSRRRSVRLNGIGSNGGGVTDTNNTY